MAEDLLVGGERKGAAMPEVRWNILTIGHLSRNRFWGESDAQAYRAPLCTCTLVREDGRTIVVDPSLPAGEMARVLDERSGLSCVDVDTVVLTHFHGDHRVGLDAFGGARWCMAAEEIRGWVARTPAGDPAGAILARLAPLENALPPGVDLLPTPGHTPGHHALTFRSEGLRVVIAGDAVMTRDFFLARTGYFNTVDPKAAVRSIDAIASCAAVVVPGHDNLFLNPHWVTSIGNGGREE
jgi:glyoxylase-like metal-dependent hydrolase (beta-lactamase superfamily II)